MNKTDMQLISALRQNARASVSDLAKRLRVSRTTVRTRIDGLLASEKFLASPSWSKGTRKNTR